MRSLSVTLVLAGAIGTVSVAGSPVLLEKHCARCHNEKKAKGKFKLADFGERPAAGNLQRWLDALDLVTSGEMPPEEESELDTSDRSKLISHLKKQLAGFEPGADAAKRTRSRRLNNREFANSVRDVLLIEDIGAHQPTANLIGDSRHEGFDTHGDTLGFSKFHLEQYIEAVRKIVDATILSGKRPATRRYEIAPTAIRAKHYKQNTQRRERQGRAEGFDFLDPRQLGYFEDLEIVPDTGRYKITIRVIGKDRGVYDAEDTGVYHGDPILLTARMGDREKTFELADERVTEIELDEWLAAGTRFLLEHPTDGLKNRGNGNFKFQYAIGGEHIRRTNPERWRQIVAGIKTKPGRKPKRPESWHHWVDHWRGPRPRILGATIDGPYFDSWPPKRQVALLGQNPTVKNAARILRPIAERAWRRPVRKGELDRILSLVRTKAATMTDIDALKEGIVAILVSPAFLLHNLEGLTPAQRFASKFSYLLDGTIPDTDLRVKVANGRLNSLDGIRNELRQRIAAGEADSFLREFPFGWLKLNDINFMAPDPDRYRFYHRKDVSEDMVNEVLAFFRHAVENNVPVPELIAADYSFVNADLARVYDLKGVPEDSRLRKYTFVDRRRGGLLGMSAFLTVTADSLGTSPIHRAIYVMENILGIHPKPPPPNVTIEEPDVRQAKTIKEILEAHRSDPNCASCHQSIDPYGYAFENFDPTGAWRDMYVAPETAPEQPAPKNRKPDRTPSIPIDASARFRNGDHYRDIVEYRRLMTSGTNRDRFVRCFITKLLTYAKGAAPAESEFAAIDAILAASAAHDHQIISTVAAVIDSPLFREE